MRAANTSWQMRAARLQVNRQTKYSRKVPAVRLQSDTYQPPIAARFVNTLSPAFFLIQRTKSPACSRFTPGASGAGHYLTYAILPAATAYQHHSSGISFPENSSSSASTSASVFCISQSKNASASVSFSSVSAPRH